MQRPDRGLRSRDVAGELRADAVVLATGAYQRAHRPEAQRPCRPIYCSRRPGLPQRAALPPGGVLVVGSGQSGCQIAEELHEAGRDSFSRAGRRPGRRAASAVATSSGGESSPASWTRPWVPADPGGAARGRTPRHGATAEDTTSTSAPSGGPASPSLGRFLGADGQRARFADDLAASVAWGDERHAEFLGLPRPRRWPRPAALRRPTLRHAGDRPAGLGAVVFATGFRPDYSSWLPWPEAFDDSASRPRDGASTVVPGLHFVGVHFLRTRKSSLLVGVGEDAAIVAEHVAESREAAELQPARCRLGRRASARGAAAPGDKAHRPDAPKTAGHRVTTRWPVT